MSAESVGFERLIERIQRLIEQPGSQVTWNDHIPDPDNPVQMRQIDISIRRDNSLTLVECRLHSAPQDVKWVEELIGRRQSLQADAVMAVSSSGFTKGALAKAKAYNVMLRDIHTLTEEQVSLWGHKTRAWLQFVKFSSVKFNIVFGNNKEEKDILMEKIINHVNSSNVIGEIITSVASKIDPNILHQLKEPRPLVASANFGEPTTSDAHILAGEIRSIVQLLEVEVGIPSVLMFGEPKVSTEDREVFVERLQRGESNIIKSTDKAFISIDLSNIVAPINSIFYSIMFDLGKSMFLDVEIVKWPILSIALEDDIVVDLYHR